jgi:hypothetical protein
MTRVRSDEGGIPRSSWRLPRAGVPSSAEGRDANEAMRDKLRRNSLRRRARGRGLELRQSAYGYSLIDSARNRLEDRNDMSLDEVEACLERQDKPGSVEAP